MGAEAGLAEVTGIATDRRDGDGEGYRFEFRGRGYRHTGLQLIGPDGWRIASAGDPGPFAFRYRPVAEGGEQERRELVADERDLAALDGGRQAVEYSPLLAHLRGVTRGKAGAR